MDGKTMTEKKTTTVSLGNTPVQRALAKAKKSSLLLLFVIGITAGFVYKTYFAEKPGETPSPAATEQRP